MTQTPYDEQLYRRIAADRTSEAEQSDLLADQCEALGDAWHADSHRRHAEKCRQIATAFLEPFL